MKLTKEELDKLIEEAPKNDKGQPVISEEDFMDNLKDLPDETRSDTGLYAKAGGYLKPLGRDAVSKAIQSKGGINSNIANKKRKTFAESIDMILKHEVEEGVTFQDKVIQAMIDKASSGCVGAAEFLRDTVGEKPTENMLLDVMTDADRELIEQIQKRINGES